MRSDRVALISLTGLVIVVVAALTLIGIGASAWTSTPPHRISDRAMGSVSPSSTVPSSTTTTTTFPLATSTTTVPTVIPSATFSVGSDVLAQWTRVAVCEEGGWIGYAGPSYPDSLGINATNWIDYGGGSDLSPSAQIAVAQRIEAAAGTPGFVPDQSGCAAW